jgi:hypothetical protein
MQNRRFLLVYTWWMLLLAVAFSADWQWHTVGSAGQWSHSVSYAVVSSSGNSCPFPMMTNSAGVNYGGFIYPYDRRVMCARNDFDGDAKSDCFYYHPSQVWYLIYSSSTQTVNRLAFGLPHDVAVPEDYDGDLLTDFAVYQERSGLWTVLLSSQGYAAASIIFGGRGYSAIPADFDGDLKADPAIYHRTSGTWMVMRSTDGYRATSSAYGGLGYTCLTGDFDEDDKADPVIYNEGLAAIGILLSGSGYLPVSAGYGGLGFTLLTTDYDGDGCTDLAAYGRDSGLWYVINYKLEHIIWGTQWGGGANYQPLEGDYDGDRRADAAVFYRDQHDTVWHMNESTAGPQSISARSNRR